MNCVPKGVDPAANLAKMQDLATHYMKTMGSPLLVLHPSPVSPPPHS